MEILRSYFSVNSGRIRYKLTTASWILTACLFLMPWIVLGSPVSAQAKASPQIDLVMAPSAQPVDTGEPVVFKFDAPWYADKTGACCRIIIEKAGVASPFLFTSYLPKGEILRTNIRAAKKNTFIYTFEDVGTYTFRVESGIAPYGPVAKMTVNVGPEPKALQRTIIWLVAVFLVSILFGYWAFMMRAEGVKS